MQEREARLQRGVEPPTAEVEQVNRGDDAVPRRHLDDHAVAEALTLEEGLRGLGEERRAEEHGFCLGEVALWAAKEPIGSVEELLRHHKPIGVVEAAAVPHSQLFDIEGLLVLKRPGSAPAGLFLEGVDGDAAEVEGERGPLRLWVFGIDSGRVCRPVERVRLRRVRRRSVWGGSALRGRRVTPQEAGAEDRERGEETDAHGKKSTTDVPCITAFRSFPWGPSSCQSSFSALPA